MPFLQKKCLAFNNDAFDSAQVHGFDALAAPKPYLIEPELAFTVAGTPPDFG